MLTGVDLRIKKGESMVIIGKSGCGKSVLLKHIVGLDKPDAGSIRIDGTDIASISEKDLMEIRRKFGVLFQHAALFDSMSVYENVGFFLIEHKIYKEQKIREIVRDKLKLVGLAGIEEQMPSSLSGGMRKRVGLARAITNSPEIILYDEPTTGIDPIMGKAINNLIVYLHRELKVTSVTVTHDMDSAYTIADRIALLYNGKVICVDTPDNFRKSDIPEVREFINGGRGGGDGQKIP